MFDVESDCASIKILMVKFNFILQVPAAARQKRFLDDMANKYARLLHMNLYTGLNADMAVDLEVCRLPSGKPWVLGYGACGIVYKVSNIPDQICTLLVSKANPCCHTGPQSCTFLPYRKGCFAAWFAKGAASKVRRLCRQQTPCYKRA